MTDTFDIVKALETVSGGENPFKINDIGLFVTNIIEVIMIIAAIATLVYLFWGGLEWITSGGDKAGTEKAKSKITDAIIGLVVVFCAWAIFQVLQSFLGFNITGGGSPAGGGAGAGGQAGCNLDVQKYNFVSSKQTQAGCIKDKSIDWSCWKFFIEGHPCSNFYVKGDDYWWNTHKECSKPAPLCP